MAAARPDWSVLRGTLVGFVLCVLIAGGMLTASAWFKQRMEREYRVNHNRFLSASRQYLAVDEEERIIEQFYPEFVTLYRAGLLGPERRLSWVETLRGADAAIGLPELSYEVEAQRESAPDFPLELGRFSVYASPMRLNAGLLHEGDLLQLLAILERDALGQYTVRSCALRRLESAVEPGSGRANLRAECSLEWLTLDLAGPRELEL